MLANDFLENVPHDRLLPFDHFARLFDGGGVLVFFKLVINERLEQLERHLLWQTALVQLELGADHDDRTARVIDTLTEQVLSKASLFALERSGKRFQRAIVRTAKHATSASVVEQSIDSFLQHALFVADNDLGRPELDELFETVVTVDNATIKIVKIRRRETTAVERHQWPELGRDDRNNVEDHPFRFIT